MYKIGIFKKTKSVKGHHLLRWLKKTYSSYEQADKACDDLNIKMGIAKNASGWNTVPVGKNFAMYDDVE